MQDKCLYREGIKKNRLSEKSISNKRF